MCAVVARPKATKTCTHSGNLRRDSLDRDGKMTTVLPLFRYLLAGFALSSAGVTMRAQDMTDALRNYTLTYASPVDPKLQRQIEVIDARLRATHGMAAEQTAVGVRSEERRVGKEGRPRSWAQQ